MRSVSAIAALAAEHLLPIAEATTLSDLLPYVALMALGFLLGAWGGQLRSPLAIAVGITLIMLAVALFVLANTGTGGSGSNPPPV
jgi:hypothetical protein